MSPWLSQTVSRVSAFLCFVRAPQPLTHLPVRPPALQPPDKHPRMLCFFRRCLSCMSLHQTDFKQIWYLAQWRSHFSGPIRGRPCIDFNKWVKQKSDENKNNELVSTCGETRETKPISKSVSAVTKSWSITLHLCDYFKVSNVANVVPKPLFLSCLTLEPQCQINPSDRRAHPDPDIYSLLLLWRSGHLFQLLTLQSSPTEALTPQRTGLFAPVCTRGFREAGGAVMRCRDLRHTEDHYSVCGKRFLCEAQKSFTRSLTVKTGFIRWLENVALLCACGRDVTKTFCFWRSGEFTAAICKNRRIYVRGCSLPIDSDAVVLEIYITLQ